MRTLFLICLVLTGLTLNAQQYGPKNGHHPSRMDRPDFTPEQIAELRVKELTLKLDLNVSQQQAISKLELEAARDRKERMASIKASKEKLTDEERFEQRTRMLDMKIAHKNSMRSILNQEQFEKWERTLADREKHRKSRKHRRGEGGKR